ncbi:MAG: hypothetical protein KJN71_04570 [Acidimicrobiia bacterium]|nr:hypothetical protein [Acidimicrobiia bacterium]
MQRFLRVRKGHAIKVLAVFTACALWASGCGSNPSTDIEAYAEAWVEAWAEADPYDIARFYDVDIEGIQIPSDSQIDNPAGFLWAGRILDGAGELVEWIPSHIVPRDRVIDTVAVDEDSAVVTVIVPERGSATWHHLEFGGDQITSESVVGWRNAHKPLGAPDARLGWVDDLVDEYVATWPPDATIRTIVSGDRTGPAIFTSIGSEPSFVGVLIDLNECTHAIELDVEERSISDERRLIEPSCTDNGPEQWWQELQLPGRIQDRDPTLVTINEMDVQVQSWTPEAEALLAWGIDRFGLAGLTAPSIRSVGFSPNVACTGAAGVAVDNADGSGEFVLCTNADQFCLPDRGECSDYATAARLGLLHELAHVWLLANLDRETEDAFIEMMGLETWQSGSVPWQERGAEQAAEILAWGLMDERLDLVRIGNPSCEAATAAFVVLTGTEPGRGCS